MECPLKDLFQDMVTAILRSRMGVSKMVMIVGKVITVIYGIIHILYLSGPEKMAGLSNIPLKGPFWMVKWRKNNDNDGDDEKFLVSWKMTMTTKPKRKFLLILLTTIHDQ